MKDEIKEILDYFRKYMSITDCIKLSKIEDYITNLQQIEQEHQKLNGELREENKKLQEENERLKEENKRIFSKVNDDELLISNAMNYAEAQKYKSRCEKAIEYCELNKEFTPRLEDVENILNGGDDNE